MLLQQFYQTADKFVGISMLMHIDAAVFRNMKAEAVFFSRNRDISQLFRKRSRKSRKPCKHFGFRILCIKKMIQGTEWIVQADGFFAKTQFCLFFFNNINQIFFKSVKIHTYPPYLYSRKSYYNYRNCTSALQTE